MKPIKNKSEISGLLGESLKVRKVNNDVVIKNRPQRKVGPPTQKQLDIQEKFLLASAYAKGQVDDPTTKAEYATRTNASMKTAYMVALGDYLNPPKVIDINKKKYFGAIGDMIVVTATDDFEVKKVEVIITDVGGNIVEQGEASPNPKNKLQWNYNAKVANPVIAGTKIQATAFDRPDHEGTLEIVV